MREAALGLRIYRYTCFRCDEKIKNKTKLFFVKLFLHFYLKHFGKFSLGFSEFFSRLVFLEPYTFFFSPSFFDFSVFKRFSFETVRKKSHPRGSVKS